MTEEEAQAWLDARGWWNGAAGDRLRRFVDLVLAESDRQNLISSASKSQIWSRHIVDSLQLLDLLPSGAREAGLWVDLGTGAGFPGFAIACVRAAPTRLIEIRQLRVTFLRECARALQFGHVEIIGSKVENAFSPAPAAVISARAYAPLDRLLASAHHLADENTIWLLPKGRQSEKELEIVRHDWQAVFHVEQSITDTESSIVTISQLRSRAKPTSHIASHGRRSRKSSGPRS